MKKLCLLILTISIIGTGCSSGAPASSESPAESSSIVASESSPLPSSSAPSPAKTVTDMEYTMPNIPYAGKYSGEVDSSDTPKGEGIFTLPGYVGELTSPDGSISFENVSTVISGTFSGGRLIDGDMTITMPADVGTLMAPGSGVQDEIIVKSKISGSKEVSLELYTDGVLREKINEFAIGGDDTLDDMTMYDAQGNITSDGIFKDGKFYKRRGTFAIGESADIDGILYTVNSYEYQNSYLAAAGNHYLVLDITIENSTSEIRKAQSRLYMGSMYSLSDSEGYRYDAALVNDANLRGSLGEEIPAGGKLRGQIAFEIPQDADGLTLLLKPESGDTVQFTIT
ncbi:DUF4352 domain-containing protein [Anaerotruncus rubiinfantis]|uniref:DUF4352 domain-containing protein n=1 Tax=Anaerotruncus rubiinfantis TaxID=1720200 RepID=UPI003D7B6AAE